MLKLLRKSGDTWWEGTDKISSHVGCILVFCFAPIHSMVFMAPISWLVKCIILQGFLDDPESKVHAGFLIKFPASSLLVGEFRANLISSSPGNSTDLLSRSLDRWSVYIVPGTAPNSPRNVALVRPNQFFSLSDCSPRRRKLRSNSGPDYLLEHRCVKSSPALLKFISSSVQQH